MMSSRYSSVLLRPDVMTSPKTNVLIFIYGLACYLVFLAAFVYVVAFVGNLFIARSIDGDSNIPFSQALVTDIGLITLFGIQHSVMAREKFKKWWTRIIPQPIERSTFVLFSSVLLLLLAWQWQPLSGVIWQIEDPIGRVVLQGIFWLGWLIVLASTFLINHFDLFGLKQVYLQLRGKEHHPPEFRTPLLYRVVRHPMMLGLLIAFWATPRMSVGHLVFAVGMTIYILIGIKMEERDLMQHFGDQYGDYQRKTPMLIPSLIRK